VSGPGSRLVLAKPAASSAQLDPAVRDLIRRVIVPALVERYIAEHGLSSERKDVVDKAASGFLSSARALRNKPPDGSDE
jgi:hypothetical protein